MAMLHIRFFSKLDWDSLNISPAITQKLQGKTFQNPQESNTAQNCDTGRKGVPTFYSMVFS